MKQIELKDLEYNKIYYAVYRQIGGNIWHPCPIRKYIDNGRIRFKTFTDIIIDYNVLWHDNRAIDINGHKVILINTFQTFIAAEDWCNFENNII